MPALTDSALNSWCGILQKALRMDYDRILKLLAMTVKKYTPNNIFVALKDACMISKRKENSKKRTKY